MSDSVEKINLDFKKVLSEEGKTFSNRVKENLSSKGVTKSGRTANSLREEVSDNGLIVWGAYYFENLEKGVSPQQAQRLDFNRVRDDLYKWSKYLPLTFNSTKERFSFAWNTANKIVKFGTKLFREGGRKDIYSNEFQPLMDSISDRIGKIIIEHKLL